MSFQSRYVIGLYRDVNPTKTDVTTISRAYWVDASADVDVNEEEFSTGVTKVNVFDGVDIMRSKTTLFGYLLICSLGFRPPFTGFINACSSIDSADQKLLIHYFLFFSVQNSLLEDANFYTLRKAHIYLHHAEKKMEK